MAILSENGVDHALLALGAMHVGVPVTPVSPTVPRGLWSVGRPPAEGTVISGGGRPPADPIRPLQ